MNKLQLVSEPEAFSGGNNRYFLDYSIDVFNVYNSENLVCIDISGDSKKRFFIKNCPRIRTFNQLLDIMVKLNIAKEVFGLAVKNIKKSSFDSGVNKAQENFRKAIGLE